MGHAEGLGVVGKDSGTDISWSLEFGLGNSLGNSMKESFMGDLELGSAFTEFKVVKMS